jgi:hypothetical protein
MADVDRRLGRRLHGYLRQILRRSLEASRAMKRVFQCCLAYALVASPASICLVLVRNLLLLSWQNAFTALVIGVLFALPWVTRKSPFAVRELLLFSTLKNVLYAMLAFVVILSLTGYFLVRDQPESALMLTTVALNWTMFFAVLFAAFPRTERNSGGDK